MKKYLILLVLLLNFVPHWSNMELHVDCAPLKAMDESGDTSDDGWYHFGDYLGYDEDGDGKIDKITYADEDGNFVFIPLKESDDDDDTGGIPPGPTTGSGGSGGELEEPDDPGDYEEDGSELCDYNRCDLNTEKCTCCHECGGACLCPNKKCHRSPCECCANLESLLSEMEEAFTDLLNAVSAYNMELDEFVQVNNELRTLYADSYGGSNQLAISNYENAVRNYQEEADVYVEDVEMLKLSVEEIETIQQILRAAEFEYSIRGEVSSDPILFQKTQSSAFEGFLKQQPGYVSKESLIRERIRLLQKDVSPQFQDSLLRFNQLIAQKILSQSTYRDTLSRYYEKTFIGDLPTAAIQYERMNLLVLEMDKVMILADSLLQTKRVVDPTYLKEIKDPQLQLIELANRHPELMSLAERSYALLFSDILVSDSLKTKTTKVHYFLRKYSIYEAYNSYNSRNSRRTYLENHSEFEAYTNYFYTMASSQGCQMSSLSEEWNGYITTQWLSFQGKSSMDELKGSERLYQELETLMKIQVPDTTIAYHNRMLTTIASYQSSDAGKRSLMVYLREFLQKQQQVDLAQMQITEKENSLLRKEQALQETYNELSNQGQVSIEAVNALIRDATMMREVLLMGAARNVESKSREFDLIGSRMLSELTSLGGGCTIQNPNIQKPAIAGVPDIPTGTIVVPDLFDKALFLFTYGHYLMGNGTPIVVDTKLLDFSSISSSSLKDEGDGVYTVNLLDVSTFGAAGINHTALALGGVKLIKRGENLYEIAVDTYDFDIRWKDGFTSRNIATDAGYLTHHIPFLYSMSKPHTMLFLPFLVGKTFDIYFKGLIYIKP